MESALAVILLPVPTDGRALGRRTRSSKLSFWLKRKKRYSYSYSVGHEEVMLYITTVYQGATSKTECSQSKRGVALGSS